MPHASKMIHPFSVLVHLVVARTGVWSVLSDKVKCSRPLEENNISSASSALLPTFHSARIISSAAVYWYIRFRAAPRKKILMQKKIKYCRLINPNDKLDRVECHILANWGPVDLLYLPKLITDVRHGQWWEDSSLHRKRQSGLKLNHRWIM